MTQLYLFEKEQVMKKKDYVATVIQEWIDAMDHQGVGVQPKCITLLGTILAKYKITKKDKVDDIWQQALTIKGGDFSTWYKGLTDSQKREYELGRQKASEKYDPREKQLLKG